VLAELLADGVQLLAQEVLALLLLRARLHVLADALAHLQLRQAVALQLDPELQPLDHVERLEELDLLGEREVWRVSPCVRERAGVGDRANEGTHASVVAAELENLVDDGPILALELGGPAGRRRDVGMLLDLHAQGSFAVAVRRTCDPAMEAA